jgi:hypothetical protein
MTHAGKGLEVYANKEASGSHGGLDLNRSIALVITLRDRAMEVVHLRGKHTTPSSYLPTFLDNQPQRNCEDEIEDNFEQYASFLSPVRNRSSTYRTKISGKPSSTL